MNTKGIIRAIISADELCFVSPSCGPLHCLLEDGNFEDGFCRIDSCSTIHLTDHQRLLGEICSEDWLALTQDERKAAYHLKRAKAYGLKLWHDFLLTMDPEKAMANNPDDIW